MRRRLAWAGLALAVVAALPGVTFAGDPPAEAQALFARGKEKQTAGDLDGALADYTRALELDGTYTGALNNRGNVRQAKGDLTGAVADFTRALELDPGYQTAWFNRGNAKSDQGDLEGAIADYSRAIELDAKDAQAFNNRGGVKDRNGDTQGALADYGTAIDLDPKYVRALDNRGALRADLGDTDGAIADFTRAIELDPRWANAWSGRGMTKFRLRDFAGCIRDLSKALEIAPSRVYSRFFLFLAQSIDGSKDAARAALVAGLAAAPAIPEGSYTGLVADFLQGKLPAEALIQAAADVPVEKGRLGRECEACFYAGMVAWIGGDKAAAVKLLERCVATKRETYVEHITARAVLGWPR